MSTTQHAYDGPRIRIMSDPRQAEDDPDRTALISILRENRRSEVSSLADDYDILICFVGSVLLPPYLPRIHAEGPRYHREEILQRLKGLAQMYSESYSDHELTRKEAWDLTEKLKSLGTRVLHHLNELKKVVLSLADFRVKNVIFLTDDYEIPWSLSCFGSGPDFRFLSSEYPCGTLLVDDADDALARLKKHNVRHRQQLGPSTRMKRVCIVCGDLGGGEAHSGLAFDYAQSLADFFRSDRTCDFEVECLGPQDWRQHSRGSKALIGWLNEEFENAEIVHYIGHVKEGLLWFDDRTKIDSQSLNVTLDPLDSRPLVVLQACESASFAASEEAGSHLCKVFLEKGASGCLAPVLPISIPTRLERFGETLIALFYKNIIENIPYGRSLANAQNEHQKKWDGDPQGFFFQLFGDPRAVWRPSVGAPTHLALMTRAIAAGQTQGASEMLMRVSCEGLDLSEGQVASELLSILRTSPEVVTHRQVPVARELGLAEAIVGAGPFLLFTLTTLWNVGGRDAMTVFLTDFARRLAARLVGTPEGKEPAEDENRKGAPRQSGTKAASNVRKVPQGRIKIDVGRSKIEIGLKDGKVEIKIVGSGEVGQVADASLSH